MNATTTVLENDSPGRVTFVLTQSLDCPSGIGRYWPLAQGLTVRGCQVQVLALHPDLGALAKRRFNRDGVEVWYVGQMHVRKIGSQKRYYGPLRLMWVAALATIQLTLAAVTSPSDVYHLGKAQPMNSIAGLVLLALGRKVYLDCDDLESASNRFGAGWQRKVVAWFEDRLPARVHGVTVNTRFLQARVRSLTSESQRIVLVPNAVSSRRFQMPSAEAVAQVRHRLQLEGRPVIVYVGSMNLVNHAVDLLLDGFAQVVVRDLPHAVLVLVGGGADLAWLQGRAVELGIERNTRFVGRVSPEEVPAYYAAADVSVDPVWDDETAQARSPLKLYESLAMGTPIVTGDVGDRRQVLGGHRGMLVPAGDVGALGARLSALLRDHVTRADLRAWALAHRDLFFWDSRIDEFMRVYESN